MAIPRIHCDMTLGPGAQFALEPPAAQHVSRALRLKTGDSIVVFDGRGGEYDAALTRVDRDRVDVKLGPWRDAGREPALIVGLVQGLPEADKMDWIIQKAVELGVAWVQPVVCERSVVRIAGERAERRAAHWKRVAIAACEQSGRNVVPDVRPVLSFVNWIAAPAQAARWMLLPGAPALTAHDAPRAEIELVVGPEGGFSERELDLAATTGCEQVSLGPRVLRTETAPLAALAAIHALWGDFRAP
jgi:16S rRNA (uracil1498-N3)-methyltransferase